MKPFQFCSSLIFVSAVSLTADMAIAADDDNAAGEMTTKRLSGRTYIVPGKQVKGMEALNFWTGFSLFRDPWVIAPSSTKDRDGLGPLFNARSCVACHKGGSRGKMSPEGTGLPTSLIIKFGSKSGLPLEQAYGAQLQPRAIQFNHGKLKENPKPEAWLNVKYETITGRYADGTEYQLQKPDYALVKLGYGELPADLGMSPRLATNVYGAGLLDAISDADLLAQQDINDADNDGISAKYNQVRNNQTGKLNIGRFGVKATEPNLRQQVAAAFRHDIGITNSLFPEETCTSAQPACFKAAALGEHDSVELPDKLLDLVVEFNAYLGVPPHRNKDNARFAKGQALFTQAGCQQCHTPSYTTSADYPLKHLANVKISPYSDLALHDMGEGLADEYKDGIAGPREWRTTPLWGIGLQKKFSGEGRYLHDGRARTIEEAILWHGGEANAAKNVFLNFSKQQRQDLLLFLSSI